MSRFKKLGQQLAGKNDLKPLKMVLFVDAGHRGDRRKKPPPFKPGLFNLCSIAHAPVPMAAATYQNIKDSLQQLYLHDPRPWLVGFSGGKDSTLVAALVFDAVLSLPPEQRTKPVTVLCTDTRVEIPAIAEGVESTLERMRRCSQEHGLNIEAHLLKPPPEQSFWVNIIGRGYPPPNRVFRWCTQRLKIDPVTSFVQRRMEHGHWSEASRAQTMAGREKRNGLNRHPDLPRVWVSNPIEFLTTEEVWAWLLQKPNPWGGDNRALYKLYASASNGECPIQIDTSTPSCGHSRFGCWTCTVVERDNWVARATRLRASATRRRNSEGLLASGNERMEKLIEFRETLLFYQDPANGKRDLKRKNGSDGPGPLTIEARRELLARLLALQEEVGFKLISDDELFLIQQQWKSARRPDDGGGVARIVTRQKGILMSDWKETNRLRELQEEVAAEKGIRADTLRR
jgi:DNA sulfur modification protein DndC